MAPPCPFPGLRLLAALAGALLPSGRAFAQDSSLDIQPCEAPIYAGVYRVATGELMPPVDELGATPGVLYRNDCFTGFFSAMLNGSTVLDDGRIPTTTSPSPNTGTIDNYRVTTFQIAYCTRDLTGVFSIRVRFWEASLQTATTCTNLAGLGTPTADILLTNLPGSATTGTLACFTVDIDLTGASEFCFRGDSNGTFDFDAFQNGFGYGLTMLGQTGTTTTTTGGFTIAGKSSGTGTCPQAIGTYYNSPGSSPATGLDNDPRFYRDGMGGQSSGCFAGFGGDAAGSVGFHMVVTADLAACAVCPNAGPDSDGDGTPNICDGCPTDPTKIDPGLCGCLVPETDSDADTVPDCVDGCPSDPLKWDPGQCGCFNPDTDTDGDLTADCVDGCPTDPNKIAPGVCGCGVPDVDTDGDTVLDCNDGCPIDPNKTAPGVCGCGFADVDTDGDTFLDCLDNCPGVSNSGQEDGDTDGVGDVCDNCVLVGNPSQDDCDNDSEGDACEIAGGAPDCNLNGVPDACDVAGGYPDLNANGIPDECEQDGGTPYCFGSSGCPCGNDSNPAQNAGCSNSTGSGGKLVGSGSTSVSFDTLVLSATNLPGALAVFLQGTSVVSLNYGDGHRCAGAPLIRIGNKNPSGGSATYPTGSDLPISVKGIVPPTGGVCYYQTWYRNFTGPCHTGFNVTNGVSVVWSP